MRNRLVALVLAVLLLPFTPVAYAAKPDEYPCLHPDMTVSAKGEVLSTGTEIALDGGMAHAGTGLTLTFQARTFNLTIDLCNLRLTDARTWQVNNWPCENTPKPKPARTQSLSWSVFVPLDCKFIGSPNLLSVSLTNGKGSASASVMIYAGAPGFVLPDKQARAFFGPFAMQSDPVNSLTGALAAVETDASVTALGVPLTVTRTYNSNDGSTGTLGAGWRASYSDRLELSATGARYLASDGREIGFTRLGKGFAVEQGAARFTLARSGSTYLLTSIDQVRMQFSAAGELQAIRDRNGQGVTIGRDSGRVRTVVNGRRSLSYDYNSQGQIASVRLSGPGVAPRTVRYEYADGRLVGVTSPGGIRTRYEYSGGRLTSETVGDAAKPAYMTEYDADGRIVAQTDAKGGRSTWSWKTEGIRGTSTMTDPTGGKWINEYERNWLIRQTDPTGATATFHYDADGNLIRVFDSLGHGARHEYDSLGRVVASTDAVGAVTRRTYNARNDVVATVDPLGRRTTYTYDVRGNLTGTAYAGRTSSVTYDARGLVTASQDALGRVSRHAYSADGDLVTVTDPLRQVTRIEYDGWGRPIKTTSPRGAVSTVTYNDDDQPHSQHGPLDVATSQTYDGQGRVSTLVDARGGTTKLRYDDAGAVVGVTRPSLPEATTTYDASGRVTGTVDASGRSQTFVYDGAGRTTSATYGGRTWTFAYDKAGRLIRTTLPSGKSASFVLDARGAPLRISYSDKTPAVSYTWDAAGRRTSMTDGLGVTRFGYDAFDQLTSAGPVSYRWDAVGNLTGRTAAGHTESYTWDAVNRLTSAAADGKPLASYRYDLARGTITTTQPGGLIKTEQLDVRGRTTSLSVAQNARPLRTTTSTYDAADNLTRSDDSVAGKSSYTYDPLNRLTAACYGVDQCTDDASDYIRYDYDANGNRTWEKRPSGSTWSLYGPANELQASLTTPATYPLDVPTTRRYTYDLDGNVTARRHHDLHLVSRRQTHNLNHSRHQNHLHPHRRRPPSHLHHRHPNHPLPVGPPLTPNPEHHRSLTTHPLPLRLRAPRPANPDRPHPAHHHSQRIGAHSNNHQTRTAQLRALRPNPSRPNQADHPAGDPRLHRRPQTPVRQLPPRPTRIQPHHRHLPNHRPSRLRQPLRLHHRQPPQNHRPPRPGRHRGHPHRRLPRLRLHLHSRPGRRRNLHPRPSLRPRHPHPPPNLLSHRSPIRRHRRHPRLPSLRTEGQLLPTTGRRRCRPRRQSICSHRAVAE